MEIKSDIDFMEQSPMNLVFSRGEVVGLVDNGTAQKSSSFFN